MNGSGSGPESRSTEQALGTIADETNVLSKQMQKGTLINRISILDILLSGQDNCTCGAPSYLWVIERSRSGYYVPSGYVESQRRLVGFKNGETQAKDGDVYAA